jgi:acylphosphatase
MIARQLSIHGRVQGVGFRYAMVDQARNAGVTGWVRNRRDGSVEAFVQGPQESVLRIVAWARSGPDSADVTKFEEGDASPEPTIRDFQSRPTA